jgi:hypothetical protein
MSAAVPPSLSACWRGWPRAGSARGRNPDCSTGLDFVKARGKLNFLWKFHKLIQISVSHYTVDGDASERLMLKYYEYLLRVRTLLGDECGIAVLANLESFPVDLDPSLREYHEKIAARIEAVRSTPPDSTARDRYYIHKTRPFFVDGRIYYEVTFYRAINKVSKFDRIIAFTNIDMTDKYSAMLTLQRDSIECSIKRCRSRSSATGRSRSGPASSTTSHDSWASRPRLERAPRSTAT